MYDDLIKQLRETPSRSKRELLDKAADAIEELENQLSAAVADLGKLIGDVEEIRRGYLIVDGDMDDALSELCAGYCSSSGKMCYKEGSNFRCENFRWRGPKKEG